MSRRLLIDGLVAAALVVALLQLRYWREAGLEGQGLQLYRVQGSVAQPLGGASELSLIGAAPGVYEWRGTLRLPRCGRTRFFAYGQGEVALWIEGKRLLAAIPPAGSAAPLALTEAELSAGRHRLRLRYRSFGERPASLRVMWDAGRMGGGPEPIPAHLLAGEGAAQTRRARSTAPTRERVATGLALLALALALLVWWRGPLWALIETLRSERWARNDLSIASGVFTLALLLRLWGLEQGPALAGEEALLAAARSVSALLWAGDLSPLSWQWSRGAPLGAALLTTPATLFSDAQTGARVLSALWGAVTVALLFVAGRELLGRGIAIVAALLAASLPGVVAAGREASAESVLLLFTLLTIWLFARGCRLWRAAAEGRQPAAAPAARRAFWATGWALGVTIALQLAELWVVVVLGAIFVGHFRSRLFGRGALRLPSALVALPLVAFFVALLLQPGLWSRPLSALAEQILGAPEQGAALALWAGPAFLLSRAPIWLWGLGLVGVLRGAGLLVGREGADEAVVRRRIGSALVLVWLLAAAFAMVAASRGGDAEIVSLVGASGLLALCLLAAAGIEGVARAVARLAGRADLRLAVLGLGGGAAVLLLLVELIRFHPQLAAYSAVSIDGPISDWQRRRAAQGAAAQAARYVARAARGGEKVAVDPDLEPALRACAPGAPQPPLRGRADVTLLPWSIGPPSTAWVISTRSDALPKGYRVAKALRTGDRVLLRILRRVSAEDVF